MALFLLSANPGWIQGQFNFTENSLHYQNKHYYGYVDDKLMYEF